MRAALDHLVRAVKRYRRDGGDRLAAALAMYAILALLPLLLLAMSVLGFVLAHDPDRQREVFDALSSALPGAGATLGNALAGVRDSRAATGLIGLGGLLLSGLGGVDALRDALRLMWHQDVRAGNLFTKKARDLLVVVVVGVALVVSFAVSALATGGAGVLLDHAGVRGGAAHAVLNTLSFALGVAVDAGVLLLLFTWLAHGPWPWRRMVRGAVFGGVLSGGLKVTAGWYVARVAARSTALYGSLGVAVAILVGLYLVCRAILFTAVWTVTAPGWDDVAPSGTGPRKALAESRA